MELVAQILFERCLSALAKRSICKGFRALLQVLIKRPSGGALCRMIQLLRKSIPTHVIGDA